MKEMTRDEMKALQLEILKTVDRFCRDNDIQYTVAEGTCIGAVRHMGYIPWDDDVDIAMTRPNYERFIHSFDRYHKDLAIYAPELKWDYYAPYANVFDKRTILDEGLNGHNGMEIGVKIDIFPIDGVATDIKKCHRNKRIMALLWNILYIKRVKINKTYHKSLRHYLRFLVKRVILFPVKYTSVQRAIRHFATKYSFEDSINVDNCIFPHRRDSWCSQHVFDGYKDVTFEGITVSIMNGYNEYLTKLYGDYMTPPPEEKRIASHGFKAFWKD